MCELCGNSCFSSCSATCVSQSSVSVSASTAPDLNRIIPIKNKVDIGVQFKPTESQPNMLWEAIKSLFYKNT